MFLRQLSNEQKELFLTLADRAAEANGIVDLSEQRMLEAYADEMDIPIRLMEALSVQEICERLTGVSSQKELGQMAFELVGLVLSDGEYDGSEKTFMLAVANAFGITPERLGKMFMLVSEYSDLVGRINQIVSA